MKVIQSSSPLCAHTDLTPAAVSKLGRPGRLVNIKADHIPSASAVRALLGMYHGLHLELEDVGAISADHLDALRQGNTATTVRIKKLRLYEDHVIPGQLLQQLGDSATFLGADRVLIDGWKDDINSALSILDPIWHKVSHVILEECHQPVPTSKVLEAIERYVALDVRFDTGSRELMGEWYGGSSELVHALATTTRLKQFAVWEARFINHAIVGLAMLVGPLRAQAGLPNIHIQVDMYAVPMLNRACKHKGVTFVGI